MSDGSLIFDTRVDTSGFKKGVSGLKGLASKGLSGIGSAVTGVATGIATATTALAGLGVASIKAGVEFESAFASVKKTVSATDEQLKGLEKSIRNMSKEMPQTASAIAEVMASAGQLGIATDNLEDFTKTMVQLGDATNLSSEEAATSLARLANITGMPQTEFDKLGSSIVALGNNLATTESEIVSMSLRLAGAGAQIGMSEADITGFAAALSSVGIEAEAGGSAMSTVFADMSLAVETGGDSLEDFAEVAGMSIEEFSRLFREDASSAVLAFINGLGTCEERGVSAIRVLDAMGMTEIRLRDALLRASGATDVFNNAIELSNTAWKENTALTKEAEARYQTMESQLGILKNKLTDIGISFYQDIRNPMVGVVEEANNMVDQLAEAFDKRGLQGLVEETGDVLADVVSNIADSAPEMLDAGADMLVAFIDGLMSNQDELIDSAEKIIVSLKNGISKVSSKLYDSGLDMLKALTKELKENKEEIAKGGAQMIENLGSAIKEALPVIGQAAGTIAQTIVETLLETNWLQVGMDIGSGVWEGISNALAPDGPSSKHWDDMLARQLESKGTIDPKLLAQYKELFGRDYDTGLSTTHEGKGGSGKAFTVAAPSTNTVAGFNAIEDNASARARDRQKQLEDAMEEVGDVMVESMEESYSDLTELVEEEEQKIADIQTDLLYKKSEDLIALEAKLQEEENKAYEKQLAEKEKIGISAVTKTYKKIYSAEKKAITDKEDKISKLELKLDAQALLLRNAQAMASVDETYEDLTAAKLREIAEMSETTKDLELSELMDGKEALRVEELKLVTDKNRAVLELEKKQVEDEKAIQEQLLNNFDATYSNMVSEYEKAYNVIANKQESLANKLAAFGDLFDKFTEENEQGEEIEYMKLGDLKDDVEQLSLLGKGLDALKGRGASQEFLDDYLTKYNVEDSLDFTELLLKQTDQGLNDYLALWQKKQDLANEIAGNFYKDEFSDLKTNFTDQVRNDLGLMPDEAEVIGQDTANSLAQGLRSGVETVRGAVSELVAQMQAAVYGEVGTLGNELSTTSNINQTISTNKDSSVVNALGAIYGALTAEKEATQIIEIDGKKVGESITVVDGVVRELSRRGVSLNVD